MSSLANPNNIHEDELHPDIINNSDGTNPHKDISHSEMDYHPDTNNTTYTKESISVSPYYDDSFSGSSSSKSYFSKTTIVLLLLFIIIIYYYYHNHNSTPKPFIYTPKLAPVNNYEPHYTPLRI